MANRKSFDIDEVPSQKGRIAIVTGSNTGLGYETGLALAKKEAKVIMACRNQERAEEAKQKMLESVPDGDIEILLVDLSKMDSVREFAKTYQSKSDRLDLLINNAGVMMPPYTETEDGFELQFAANHLGHFLLTGLLLDTIVKTPNARIVSLSSLAHKNGEINFDDLHSKKEYSASGAYRRSKLACLMFAFELQRRLEKAGHADTVSTAAHPGLSLTDLGRHFPKIVYEIITTLLGGLLAQSPKKGAEPTLLAALGEDVKGGEYFGPTGFQEFKGKPGKAKIKDHAEDKEVAKRLWEVSEKLTGIEYL